MENLHPIAQVACAIGTTLIVIAWFITLANAWDIFKRNKK